ncbi:MAG: hypothetical protein ACYDGR_01935 [Candidatus Dormibacteria bacterium]
MSAGALLAIIAGVLVWLGLTGQLADLRHANLPFHPYPPAGYSFNGLDPGNKDDLINIAEANKVKGDLVTDGHGELQALETGDADLLIRSDAGNRLAKEREVIAANAAQGLTERFSNQLTTLKVGRLRDPNDASVDWCVTESGATTITMVRTSTGAAASERKFRFDGKFWLRRVGDHYMIVDAEISTST